MPQAVNEVVIAAPLDRVYALARNVEVFPEFMPDVESLTVVERSEDGRRIVADWVGVVKDFRLKVKWTEEDIWDDDAHTCAFRQVKGDYQKYEGIWKFEALGDSETRFHSTLDYEIEIPLIGPLLKKIVAKLVRDNVQRILDAIKAQAEQQPA
jgi:ribosome-associated toxin RatA of RatAB toxin-antitoxin module